MQNRLTQALDFQSQALVLRAERQRLIASNIAIADTPGSQAREMDCAKALHQGATRLIALERELAAIADVDESKIEIAHEFPDLSSNSNSFMKQCLSREVYEQLKDKTTDLGVTLFDVIKVGVLDKKCKLGAVAGDEASYHVFSALMDPVIEGYHRGYKLSSGHPRDLDPSHLGDALVNPDPKGEFISSTRIRVARNLRGFPLSPKVNREQRAEIERRCVAALNSLEGELAGTYYSLTTMTDADRVQLEKDHFLFRKEHGYACGLLGCDGPTFRNSFLAVCCCVLLCAWCLADARVVSG